MGREVAATADCLSKPKSTTILQLTYSSCFEQAGQLEDYQPEVSSNHCREQCSGTCKAV
jgi:hypothetical protein